jgi:transcriptional regulator
VAARALGEALAVVAGPDAYVSPSWYPSKAEHGRVVPTWNYVQVHVHGRLVVHDDPAGSATRSPG